MNNMQEEKRLHRIRRMVSFLKAGPLPYSHLERAAHDDGLTDEKQTISRTVNRLVTHGILAKEEACKRTFPGCAVQYRILDDSEEALQRVAASRKAQDRTSEWDRILAWKGTYAEWVTAGLDEDDSLFLDMKRERDAAGLGNVESEGGRLQPIGIGERAR